MIVVKLLKDTKGGAAVEFALVSLAFLLGITFVLTVGLICYFNLSLDFATTKAARQIMTGYVQKNALTQQQFVTSVLCPYLPYGLSCSNVIVNVYTATEAAQPNGYYTFVNAAATALNIPSLSNTAANFSPGAQQAFEYMEVIYPVTFIPSAFASILGGGATYNGSPAFLLVSTSAFKNEQY